ncbi:extracelular serine carboxypeptidase-like protein [Amylocarpus encephaloides]|uniref:Extracelular serine carboxypeptidase-like protein n=1 Tax=Amylocarpus encephaloides TaxID=45428 RepID=A0A9P7YD93_9HELO|nr:extracelular serine carboxypeptidase-like protein [Amylocarpus encephaloides]
MRFGIVLASFAGLAGAQLNLPDIERSEHGSLKGRQASLYPALTIDMPIDHFPRKDQYKPHVTGTFKQRYFFDSTYYKPGGPVYLYIGGETSGTNRFSNLRTGIIQILMQATNGLGVILENRYYGQSYPFANSTTDNLRFLTTEQTIADNAYFAQHAVFPGVGANLTAPKAPWILYGGSLAGGQTAFSVKTYGDILFGGIAASAPIRDVLPYPEWYNPIQRYGPQDCIASVNSIIANIDSLTDSHNMKAIRELKEIFSLGKLKDIRDFAQTIAWPIGGPFNYPIDTWQELNWNPAYSGPEFFEFCGNVTDINAPASITAIDSQLSKYTRGKPWVGLGSYANYFKKTYLPLCPSGDYDSSQCFGTQNQTFWADVTNGGTRSYLWTTCTELGAYQVAPSSGPSLIMNVLQVDYTQQWCNWAYPKGKYVTIPKTPALEITNSYGGLNLQADRLAFIDGSVDPWLDLCYHATDAPLRTSTDLNPEYLITGAGHHWDSYGILNIAAEPLFIQQAHQWEIRTVQKWLRTFKDWKPAHGH